EVKGTGGWPRACSAIRGSRIATAPEARRRPRLAALDGRPSALLLGLRGIAEDRGVGDRADGLIAQVPVEELADATPDVWDAEAAVSGPDDLDESAGAPRGLEGLGQPLRLVERDERVLGPVED